MLTLKLAELTKRINRSSGGPHCASHYPTREPMAFNLTASRVRFFLATFKFRDILKVLGISLPETRENIRNAKSMVNNRKSPSSGGISVTDFNDDGAPDILVTRRNRGTSLFINMINQVATNVCRWKRSMTQANQLNFICGLIWIMTETKISCPHVRARSGLSFVTLYLREGNQLKKKEDILTFKEDWKRGLDYQGIQL